MWQQNIAKLMNNSGWGSGFRLPISSAENLELERELEKRHRLIQVKQAELDDINKHTAILEKALKNTSDHIIHDSKLTNAKTSEIAAEKELLKIAEKDGHHLTRECKFAHDAFNKAVKNNRELMDEIETRKRDLAELANLIEYDRKELAIIESRASDESNILAAIEEICDQDADTLRKYENRYKKATADTGNLRLELDGRVSLTRVMQTELDGIGDRFRKLHKERGEIVSMWKDTMTALTQRDNQMNLIAEMYQETDASLQYATEKVNEERKRLQTQEQSGSSSLMQLNKWDRKVMDVREEIKSVSEYGASLKDNILTYEIGISLASTEAKDLSSKGSTIDKELSEINARIAAASSQIAELREKAEESSSSMLSAAERMAALQDLIDEEGKKLQCFIKSLEKETYRKGQWLGKKASLKERWTNLDLEIRGITAHLQNCISNGKEAVMTLEKRKAAIYTVELSLISCQLKYKPLMNPKMVESTPEFEDAGRQLNAISAELDEISKTKNFVLNQIHHLRHVHKQIYREKGNLDEEIERLGFRNNEHRCEIRCSVKNLESMVEEYKNVNMDNSLIKLKLRQMMNMLKQGKSMLCCSANKRAMLDSSIKEKKSEIDAHSRILEMKKRGVKDELSQMKMQLSLITTCIMKRRDRYEIVMKLMATPEDSEPDNPKSEAYFILKMAQEREILQKEGDNWDKKVKEAEIETEALQNSLSLIKCSNDLFKDSLKSAGNDECQAEVNRLKKIEKEYLFRKNKAVTTLRKLRNDVPLKIEAIEVTQHEMDRESNRAMDREYELRVLSGDLRNQALSGKRVRMLTNKLLRGLAFSGPQEKEVVSRDIKLKATRRKFEFAIQALAKLLNVHPMMYEIIGQSLCQQFGEQTAVKFLNRVSPWIGDCPSPSQGSDSQTGGGSVTRKSSASRKPSSLISAKSEQSVLKPGKSISSVKFSTVSMGSTTSATHFSSVGGGPSRSILGSTTSLLPPPLVDVDDGIQLPERTESEQEILENIAKSVESNRQIVVEERKRKMEAEKELVELEQKKALDAKQESVTDVQSIFYDPHQKQQQKQRSKDKPLIDESAPATTSLEDLDVHSSSQPLADTRDMEDDLLMDSETQELTRTPSSSQEKEKSPAKLGSIPESPELGESKDK